MSKLTNLYYANLKEQEEIMKNYKNEPESLKKLIEYLQAKLNMKDFLEVEELLSTAISDSREEAWKDGAKYIHGLSLELSGQEETE